MLYILAIHNGLYYAARHGSPVHTRGHLAPRSQSIYALVMMLSAWVEYKNSVACQAPACSS